MKVVNNFLITIRIKIRDIILAVPVRWKVIGIGLLPVVILGLSLNYWVRLGLSNWLSYLLTDVRVDAAMEAGSRSVFFVTILAAFLSIILSLFFSEILTSPLSELKKTAEKVASGEFESRADVWANDEIGSLATSINQMLENLVEVQNDLRLTNRQLEIMNRIAFAAERDLDIHDILYIILKNILEIANLEMGWIYLYDPELNKFHLATWHNIPEKLQSSLLHYPQDRPCSCQQDLIDHTIGNRVQVRDCHRLENYENNLISRQHLTIPIEAREQRFGAINLLYPVERQFSVEAIEVLSSIGLQVSEIVANAWLELKLSEKEAARKLLLESLVSAQEDERKRLARELHDRAGQSLTNLLVRLKAIERKSNQPEIQESLNSLLEVVSNTIDQIRDLSYRLRPPALEEFGLNTAIKGLVDQMASGAGIEVECGCDLEDSLSPEVETMIFRIAQEGLANIIRHADASLIKIKLTRQLQQVYLSIEDDGKGFDPANLSLDPQKRHLGLISMNERAELIGGTFHLFSAPGEGTKLEAYVPLG
ncbi:MAG: histidine kinase [Anaerolineales bacterium]|jgi:signal transduction histidine kinase